MSNDNGLIDQTNKKILTILAEDGRISITELADRVGISKTPCQVRVKRLIDEGYILGFAAIIAPEKLDREHVAFVEVRLQDTRETALKSFNEAVRRVPQIEQCHMIASSYDYLLKVRTKDIRDYRRVLGDVISSLPHVASTSTHVSMEAVKDTVIR